MNTKRPECSPDCGDDHDWEVITVDNGDGIYSETYHYLQCKVCNKTKDYEGEFDDEPDPSDYRSYEP